MGREIHAQSLMSSLSVECGRAVMNSTLQVTQQFDGSRQCLLDIMVTQYAFLSKADGRSLLHNASSPQSRFPRDAKPTASPMRTLVHMQNQPMLPLLSSVDRIVPKDGKRGRVSRRTLF